MFKKHPRPYFVALLRRCLAYDLGISEVRLQAGAKRTRRTRAVASDGGSFGRLPHPWLTYNSKAFILRIWFYFE